MPIFMDRHDLPGVTARDVAEAHQKDLKIQDQFGCRALTYWFDKERQMAFCLIEAPDEKAVKAMHEDAHGLVPHQIIEVDSGVVESFLGRIKDQVEGHNTEAFIQNEAAFRVLLKTSLRYSNLGTVMLDGKDPMRYQRMHHDIIEQVVKHHDGREVKYANSGILCTFVNPSSAVSSALAIQNEINEYPDVFESRGVEVQIGIAAGSPVSDSNALFGQTIEQASNLCQLSANNQIMISHVLTDFCKTSGAELCNNSDIVKVLRKAEEQFIDCFLKVIRHSEKQEGWTLMDLAKRVGVSKSQLYRKLMALTGFAPNDFIKESRLQQAIHLINQQEKSVSEIAYETGFGSPSYFSKCFKKRYGLLPSKYIHHLQLH